MEGLANCLVWEGFVGQSLSSLPHPGLQEMSFSGDIFLEKSGICVYVCVVLVVVEV